MKNNYDLLIIGGGISASVFASKFLNSNPNSKIAIIEAGRGLGGRSSTRFSKKFKGWELNHGSPKFNICNNENNQLLKNFIEELLDNKFIQYDDSEIIELTMEFSSKLEQNHEFFNCNNYISLSSMSELSRNIISLHNLRDQIDFYFKTLIFDLDFKQNTWYLKSKCGRNFESNFIVSSSNLLLHNRSKEILNVDQIPLRKAIPKNEDKIVDSLLHCLKKQSFIPRLTFLIYTDNSYNYKDDYNKKYRYFLLNKDLETKYDIERVVFQRQKTNHLGIVIHTKSLNLINKYIMEKKQNKLKQNIIENFNSIFDCSSLINKLSGKEGISIMLWRASQPLGYRIPMSLNISWKSNIGFCGDWFDNEGFGRIEGSVISALKLADQLKSFN